MGGRLRGLIAGVRTGLGCNPFIPASSQRHIASGTVESVADEVDYLAETVKERGRGCREAKDLMVACEPTVMLFINEKYNGRHSIGSDIARNREDKCNEFMIEYYKWLANILHEEAEELAPPPVIPDMPDMPDIPDIPSPVDWIKSLQIIAVVVMLFIIVIVYIIFVKGKGASGVSVGSVR